MAARRYIILCSNEPAISEQILSGCFDKELGLLTFRSQESEALRAALRDYSVAGAIFDLNYCDQNLLTIIGQIQRACRNPPLVCISSRQLAGVMLSQPDRSFYFAHPQVPQLALRKLLSQPPIPGPMNFVGPLQTRTLSELVHLLQQAGLTGRVTVWTTTQRGDIWVHLGRIVHADFGGRQGHVAALTMFSWPRGNFRFQSGRPPTQTIQLGPHYLLSDAARRSLSAEPSSGSLDGLPVAALSDLEASSSSPEPEPEAAIRLDETVPTSPGATPPPSVGHSELSPPLGGGSPVSPVVIASAVSSTSSSTAADPAIARQSAATIAPIAELAAAELAVRADESAEVGSDVRADVRADEPLTTPIEPTNLDTEIKSSWEALAATQAPFVPQEEDTMAVTASSVKDALSKIEMTTDGFIGAAVADADSGMCIGSTGGAGIMNLEVAAAANTEVVRAKRKAMKTLGLRDEIEDILISLGKQYHLIRPLKSRPSVFFYVALDRGRSNLAMARYALADVERELAL